MRTSVDDTMLKQDFAEEVRPIVTKMYKDGHSQASIIDYVIKNCRLDGNNRSRSWYRSIVRTILSSGSPKVDINFVGAIAEKVEELLREGYTEAKIARMLEDDAHSSQAVFVAIKKITSSNDELARIASDNVYIGPKASMKMGKPSTNGDAEIEDVETKIAAY